MNHLKSDIIKQYATKELLKANYWNLPRWSEVTDDMLHEYTEDQARSMYRKKEAPFIFWIVSSYRDGEHIGLVTWGTDVLYMDGWGRRPESTKACIDNFSIVKTYAMDNPRDMQKVIVQAERIKAKEGTTALMSADTIREQNMEPRQRYFIGPTSEQLQSPR